MCVSDSDATLPAPVPVASWRALLAKALPRAGAPVLSGTSSGPNGDMHSRGEQEVREEPCAA